MQAAMPESERIAALERDLAEAIERQIGHRAGARGARAQRVRARAGVRDRARAGGPAVSRRCRADLCARRRRLHAGGRARCVAGLPRVPRGRADRRGLRHARRARRAGAPGGADPRRAGRPRVHDAPCARARRLPLDARGADARRRARPRRDRALARSGRAVRRAHDRARDDVRRAGRDRDPERADRARAGDRQRPQVGVPGQHVARAADAAERRDRVLGRAARGPVRRAQRPPGGVRPRHPRVRPAPARADQRDPRPVQGGGRTDGARAGGALAAGPDRTVPFAGARAGRGATAGGGGGDRRRGGIGMGRRDQAQAGRPEPALERGQVHAGRRVGRRAARISRAIRSS